MKNRLMNATMMILLLSLTAPGAVMAQSAQVEAKAAFDEGKALYAKGEYLSAALRFREAYSINPSWKLLYNIGQAEASAKRYGLALEAFEAYLLDGGDEVAPSRQDEVVKETNRLRTLVGMLEIVAPAGIEIVAEDIVRGITPLPGLIPVAAGRNHEVRAIRDGEVVAARIARVMVGQTLKVELEVPGTSETPPLQGDPDDPIKAEPSAPTAVGESSKTDANRGLRIAGWVTAGLGVGMLAGTAVTGGIAMKKNADIKAGCPDNTCPAGEDWSDVIQSRDALGVTSTVLLATGAAALAAGTVMIIVSYKKENERFSFSPVLSPDLAGAALKWRF